MKIISSNDSIQILLSSIGISGESFEQFLIWALCEHLESILAHDVEITDVLFHKPDALKKFRNVLKLRTGRDWSVHDLNMLFERVKKDRETHFRDPIPYGEYLKLLWQVPAECAYCKKKPPEVKLHIDHIIPVSKGGASQRSNLQYLCSKCNLKKSNKIQGAKPWLDLL